MLDKQINLYAVNTSSLYTDKERSIHNNMQSLLFERAKIKKEDVDRTDDIKKITIQYEKYKKELKLLIEDNKELRRIFENDINEKARISMFESTLSRTLGIKTNELTKDLIIIESFFTGVLEDIIRDGFIWENERYINYCASAGQIRKKLNIFIKESIYKKHVNSLLCGLSVEEINKKGGICINKFIAYSALTNSATDEWKNFDMRKCIVVDDFEAPVNTDVDYIDWENECEITRINKDCIIPHTDGSGIMLPKVLKKNTVIRAPFIKGLLVPFDFVSFIKDYNGKHIVKDIYGKEYNIFDDNIEIIFTKSQFKMWKYYDSWDDYCTKYEKYNCQTGITGEDVDYFKNKTFNYQMFQTLYDMSNEDIEKIVEKTNNDISKIGNDLETSLRLLGADDKNKHLNALQRCIRWEPSISNDFHSREVLRDKKAQVVKDAKSAKLNIGCKYTYLLPDVFAFSEWLFLDIKEPNGLLGKNEVYCNLFGNNEEIDVLRSPHLSIEHCVRTNVRNAQISKWFITNGIYTSVKDAISMILFFDVDGDIALLTNNPILIKNAKRLVAKHDIVPLDFKRNKPPSKQITPQNIFDSLIAAYKTAPQIGLFSNHITKILNKDKIDKNNIDEIKVGVSAVNKFIDAAKDEDEVLIPKKYKDIFSELSSQKPPFFFQYAKSQRYMPKKKKKGEKNPLVMPWNNSVTNRLENFIINSRFKFSPEEFGKFDYHVLMANKKTELETDDEEYNKLVSRIITYYEKSKVGLNKKFVTNINSKDYDFYRQVYDNIYEGMRDICKYDSFVTDVLVEYLFGVKEKVRKTLFWECWGDIVEENIKRNKDLIDHSLCLRCRKPYVKKSNRQKYCEDCSKVVKSNRDKKYYDRIGNKKVQCKKCGEWFEEIATSRRKICDKCRKEKI